MWGTIKIIILSFALLMPALAQAAITSGPLEGKPVASLRGLGNISLSDDGALPDIALPAYFEEMADYASAAYAWQAVAQATQSPPMKLQALRGAAGAYAAAGNLPAALKVFEQINSEFKGNEALTANTNQALLDATWLQAEQLGDITDAYNVPEAAELARRLADFKTLAQRKITRAKWLGVLPGLGHASVGQARVAAVMLPLWALLMWAMLFALRRREWPYAAFFALLAGGMWWSSLLGAEQAAHTYVLNQQHQALQNWADLKHLTPEKPVAKPAQKMEANPAFEMQPYVEVSGSILVSDTQ